MDGKASRNVESMTFSLPLSNDFTILFEARVGTTSAADQHQLGAQIEVYLYHLPRLRGAIRYRWVRKHSHYLSPTICKLDMQWMGNSGTTAIGFQALVISTIVVRNFAVCCYRTIASLSLRQGRNARTRRNSLPLHLNEQDGTGSANMSFANDQSNMWNKNP